MATTTPNFGWPVPTSTDLVKDGATAIEALGDGIDTSMVDLKGGTTGQILAKATNADMDFSWITNDVGDITAVTAGTGITGGGTSGAVTVSFDQANYGGGQFAAGKNKIINGNFANWQRGTTFNSYANGAYSADRFFTLYNGTGSTRNATQQTFTPGTAPVSGYEGTFFSRYDQTVAGTTATFNTYGQRIEDVRIFAGQTVTVSFWAKAAANTTFGVGIQQNFGSGGSTSVTQEFTTEFAVTTSWVRYSKTITIASISGKTIGTSSYLAVYATMPLNATFTFDSWGWQIESGSTATPFQTASGGSLQGELALCQRYYYRNFPDAANVALAMGYANTTVQARGIVKFPVTMRTRPAALEQSGTAADYAIQSQGTVTTACSAVPAYVTTSLEEGYVSFTVASGLTAGDGLALRTGAAAAYLGWSAEL